MEEIKEVIVVEGKNDVFKVQQVFKCDCFITYGYSITPRKLSILKTLAKQRGLILFLDPDTVGEKIRKKISDNIENCKHAYIAKVDARTSKKVGIEHADNSDIYKALHNVISYTQNKNHISMEFLDSLSLRNSAEATKRREILCRALNLGHCNFKALYKRLNLIQISESEIKAILKE